MTTRAAISSNALLPQRTVRLLRAGTSATRILNVRVRTAEMADVLGKKTDLDAYHYV